MRLGNLVSLVSVVTARLGCFLIPDRVLGLLLWFLFPSFAFFSRKGFISFKTLLSGQCPEYIRAFSHFQPTSTDNFTYNFCTNRKCFSRSGPSLHARRPS